MSPKRVVLTGAVAVAAPPCEAFELFTPEGERRWVDGWDPVWVDPDAIRHAIKKCGFDPAGCEYRIIATTRPGRPEVAGWRPATMLSTEGFVRHSVGTTIAANSLSAGTAYWRKL